MRASLCGGAMFRSMLFLAVTAFIAVNVPIHAQSVMGAIQGTVVDQSGGVLPGATVIVLNTATGFSRPAVTDETGTFRAELLPVGTYEVLVELPGFTSR